MGIVSKYGTMWARNAANIRNIPAPSKGGVGVYILFDGSMPVYVGKGNIRFQINRAQRSRRRGELWDRFSWFTVADADARHDIEVLLLRILPPYLRALTRQQGHFIKVRHGLDQKNKIAIAVTRRWNKAAKS